MEYLYGVHAVSNALLAGKRQFFKLYLKEELMRERTSPDLKSILEQSEKKKIPMERINLQLLNQLSHQNVHQGVVLQTNPIPIESLEYLEEWKGNKVPLWVALHEIQDPHNVGSIIRSSSCFGVQGIITGTKNSSPISPAVCKASSGLVEFMRLINVQNMRSFLESSKAHGWRVIGTDICDNSKILTVKQLQLDKPSILLLGNEGKGVQSKVFAASNITTTITSDSPMSSESFNVSVAAGIYLQQLLGK